MTVTAANELLPPGHHQIWPLTSHAEFDAVAESIPNARGYVSYFLCEWELDAKIDTGLAVISELITNAVQACWRHGVGGPVTVRLRCDFVCLVIEVEDPAPGTPYLSEHEQPGDYIGGHGLVLVAALVERWGYCRRDRGRKAVWAIF